MTPVQRAAALFIAIAILPACVYRMSVQQGNYLDPSAVSQLQVGMTRSQVRYLLGTPMLPDAFDADRWDYLYYFRTGRTQEADKRRLTVFFADDKVARFDKDRVSEPLLVPVAAASPAGQPAASAATAAPGDPAEPTRVEPVAPDPIQNPEAAPAP